MSEATSPKGLKALDIVGLTEGEIDNFIFHNTAASRVAWHLLRRDMQQMALTTMRALEKWRKEKCTDNTHSILRGELRVQRRWCNLCQEELRKALEMEP